MPATDDYATLSGKAWLAPASSSAAVTPSDSTDLTDVTRWVFVGGAGNLAVIMNDGSTPILVGVPTGALLPIRVSRIKSTGTTATNIVALW